MKNLLDDLIEIIGIDDVIPEQSGSFKQLQIQETFSIPENKPEAEHILSIRVNAEITGTQIIETPIAQSNEGQVLLGKKIIVQGKLIQKIEYAADVEGQPVHTAEFEKLFSDYIVLDDDIDCSSPVIVTPYIEDIYVKLISKRKVFKNIVLLINAASSAFNLGSGKPDEKRKKSLANRYEISKYYKCNVKEERCFTQFVLKEKIEIPRPKPDIEQIVTTIIDPEILSMKVINTIKGRSREGQNLSGKKIIVELKIKQKILYAADLICRSIHGVEKEHYQSVYVVVPERIEGTDIEALLRNKLLQPKITVEDVFARKVDERKIFKSIVLFLEFVYIPSYEICYSYQHSSSGSNLFVAYENGRHAHQITYDDDHKNIKPKWSPSGQEIACLSDCLGKFMLCLIDPETSSKRVFTQAGIFEAISSYCWSPDGGRIIFSAVKGISKEIYSMDVRGSEYEQITWGNGLIKSFRPECSPDGKRMAYIRSTSNILNIWISDAKGLDSSQITACGYIKDFDWMDDDKLVFISGKGNKQDEASVIDINSLEAERIFTGLDIFAKKLIRISPHNQYAALIGAKSNKNDIDDVYLYEFKNKCAINITKNFCTTKISDLAWGIDSNKIYYVSDELGYCNIYSISLRDFCKKQLTNTTAADIQISYRPRIR